MSRSPGRACPRGAIVALGEPIVVDASVAGKNGTSVLTERLEENVQSLLDSIRPPERSIAIPYPALEAAP